MNAVSRLGNIFEDVAIKAPVRLASTAGNLALTGLQTIDGTAGADLDRVLLTAQTDPTENGIWQITTGPWLRTADARQNTDFIDGTLVPVARGTANAGKLFQLLCTDSPVAIDSSDLVFTDRTDVTSAQQAATSTSSVAIGTGAKTFAIQTGKDFAAGEYVLVYQTSNPDNAMLGKIVSYIAGSLVLTSVAAGGAGTHTDWTVVLANSPASAGRVPPIGTGNVSGPGSAVAGAMAIFDGTTGKLLGDSGKVPGALAERTTLVYGDAGDASIGDAALVSGAAPLGRVGAQPADNLRLVNDASQPTRDINVTPGRCRDDSDVINLQLAGTMVKRLDQAWAAGGVAGSPAGACDTGTKGASQTWHIFLIAKRSMVLGLASRTSNVATISTSLAHGLGIGSSVRQYGVLQAGISGLATITAIPAANSYSYASAGADFGSVGVSGFADGFDILASQSYAAPTLPAGWTVKQCLGSFLTDGAGNIRAMTQIGDEFLLASTVTHLPAFSTAEVLFAVAVPLGVKVTALMRATVSWISPQSGYVLYSSPDETDQAPGAELAQFSGSGNASFSGGQSGEFACRTDTAARLRVRATGSYQTAACGCRGWRDPRRRLF